MTIVMDKTQTSEVLLRAKELLASDDTINQKILAERAMCSSTTISLWLKGEYNGDVTKLEKQIAQFLNIQTARKEHKKLDLGFVETSVAKRIFNISRMCQLNSEIGMAYGSSGLGKSTAIKNYAKDNAGVIIIDPDENVSAKWILEDLAQQLGISGVTKNYDLTKEIRKRLYNSGYLVIVDESENLKSLCFRTLRKLHDRCDFTFGLLFAGTEVLDRKIQQMRGDLVYLTNRIGYRERLDLLNETDVELLVKQAIPDCSDENIKSFRQLTKKNARVLFNTLKRVIDIQKKYGKKLDYEIIESAFNMTMG